MAFLVLSISVLRAASVSYSFSASPLIALNNVLGENEETKVDYPLPYPGKIGPDHPAWAFKALRDKLWFLVSTSSSRKAELMLLFADKRLGSSRVLFEKGKPEIGFSTLSKGEKYLESSWLLTQKNTAKGLDTSEFLKKLANASLKHREEIEEILVVAPEDAKPQIIKTMDYPKNVFRGTRDALRSKGLPVPENPSDWD